MPSLCAGCLQAQPCHGTQRALLHVLEGTHSCTAPCHSTGLGCSQSSAQQGCQGPQEHPVPLAPSRAESSWCQCLGRSPRAGSRVGPFPGTAASLYPLSHAQDTWPCFAAPSTAAEPRGHKAGVGTAAGMKPRWQQSKAAPCTHSEDVPGHSGKAAQTDRQTDRTPSSPSQHSQPLPEPISREGLGTPTCSSRCSKS